MLFAFPVNAEIQQSMTRAMANAMPTRAQIDLGNSIIEAEQAAFKRASDPNHPITQAIKSVRELTAHSGPHLRTVPITGARR